MKEQTNQTLPQKLWRLLPWLWLAAGYVLDLWFQLVPGRWLVDSDMASEMMLSNFLNQEGRIISKIWYYSTELRVVSVQWVYRFTLLLFPNDWHMARTVGMAIMLAAFAGLMLLLARSIGLGRIGVWMAGVLIWPYGRIYLIYAIYGGHYLVYTFLYVVSLTLVLFSLTTSRKKCVWMNIAACIVAMLSGMNGVKTLMVFQAPFVLAAMAVLILALNASEEKTWRGALRVCSQESRLMAGALATTMASFVGYIINSKVLAKMYSFKSFSGVTWNRFGVDWTLDRVLMDFFHEFGYRDGVGVFHFSGIASGIGLLIGAWMLFCIVRVAWRYKKLNVTERLIIALMLTMLAVCGVAYTYFGDYSQYFWLPCMPVAIAVMMIEIKTEDLHLPGARAVLTLVLAGAITLCSLNNVRQESEHPALAHVGLDKVADWLVDNGYKEGYATFWNGNCMVEMTSGKLDVWMPGDLNNVNVEGWLQPDYHLTRYPEHPFVLVDTATDGPAEECGLIKNGHGTEVYNDGRYAVYAFDSSDDLCAAAEITKAEHEN